MEGVVVSSPLLCVSVVREVVVVVGGEYIVVGGIRDRVILAVEIRVFVIAVVVKTKVRFIVVVVVTVIVETGCCVRVPAVRRT